MSLADRPSLIVEAALDAISENIKAECGWVQLERGEKLHLVSSRNFTREMRREVAQMELARYCAQEIVGLGKRIVIPDLSRNGDHGLSAFTAAGFRSLIAVPIMTYRALGVLGAGFRGKKDFNSDLPQLFSTIAGMLGMALKRSDFSGTDEAAPSGDSAPQERGEKRPGKRSAPADGETRDAPDPGREARHGAFQEHAHRMATFRKSHS